MTNNLPSNAASSAVVRWRERELTPAEAARRVALLAPILDLAAVRNVTGAAMRVIVARTAYLSDDDFAAACDALADQCDEVRNPIPFFQSIGVARAKERANATALQVKKSDDFVPMPDEVRKKLRRMI